MKPDPSVSEIRDASGLEGRLGVRFADPKLLVTALTHRSYSFEQGGVPQNERLEFLGDAVLGLVITEAIFTWYPQLPEGEMAKLRASSVNMSVLAEVARELGLGEQLFLGRGEELSGGRDKNSILADALEAVIGAVYADGGLAEARRLIEKWFGNRIREHVERGTVRDFKTTLQETALRRTGLLPQYRYTSSGPDHAKRFLSRVFLGEELLGTGEGRSKKESEQAAAKEALAQLEARPEDNSPEESPPPSRSGLRKPKAT